METDSIDANIFDTMDLSESALAAFNISDISLDESLLYTTPDDSIESSFSSFCSDDQPSPSTPVSPDHEDYLFDGSKLTVFQSYLLIMKYALRHGLTKLALSDLLDLVGLHLPNSSMLSSYRYIHALSLTLQ